MDNNSGGKASRAKNCAECRRLKIKCDRVVPCSNCVKQGKAALCPDGTLLPKGQRVILSVTEDFPSKIEQLESRIKELEGALAHLQAMLSTEPHPLLLPKSPQRSPSPATSKKEEEETDATAHGIGSLMIGERGNVRFFGSTSSLEWTVVEDGPGVHLSSADYPTPSFQDTESRVHSAFGGVVDHGTSIAYLPLIPLEDEVVDMSLWKQKVIHGLPERELATKLVGTYYSRAAWESCPVRRTEFVQEYFGRCYERPENPPITMHQLGFIYGVFALGALHSHDIPSSDALARQYMTLSQSCLRIDDCLRNTNLTVLNTLLLQIAYYFSCDDSFHSKPSSTTDTHGPYSISPARGHVLLGVAMKLAGVIGLHREPSIWGLPAKEIAQRRRTMWELINLDLWTALISGRPPSFARQHLDVKLPVENPEVSDPDPNYDVGKFHFTSTCLWDIVNLGLASPRTTSYAAVLQVDKKVRQWRLPESMMMKSYESSEQQKTMMMFKNTMGMIFREITLLCLHRCYFASALLSPTFDLITSPFSRSVLAAYASSCTILSRVRALYAAEPIAIMRFSLFWTHAFSSAVILGAIAIRAPDCSLAAVALTELDLAVEMFQKAQAGYRARRGLPTLRQLHASARESMKAYQNGTWVRNTQADSKILRNMVGLGVVVQESSSPPQQQPPQGPVSASTSRPQHQPTVSTSTTTSFSPPPPSISSLPRLSHSVNSSTSAPASHPAVISPSLDEFLRTFDFGASQISLGGEATGGTGGGEGRLGPQVGGQTYVPTSDQFLNSVMTGNWGQSLFPPSPLVNTDRAIATVSTTGAVGAPNMYQDFSLYAHDSSSSPAQHPTPPSDGGSSYYEGAVGTGFNNSMGVGGGVEQPPSMLSPFMIPRGGESGGGEYSMEEELRKSLVWDNFLKELGIQGTV